MEHPRPAAHPGSRGRCAPEAHDRSGSALWGRGGCRTRRHCAPGLQGLLNLTLPSARSSGLADDQDLRSGEHRGVEVVASVYDNLDAGQVGVGQVLVLQVVRLEHRNINAVSYTHLTL